jgi:hypothetical protein
MYIFHINDNRLSFLQARIVTQKAPVAAMRKRGPLLKKDVYLSRTKVKGSNKNTILLTCDLLINVLGED